MNILLDFLPLQKDGGVGGAATFAMKVCDEVVLHRKEDTSLFAVYNSTMATGRLYNHDKIARENNIVLIDISKVCLAEAIKNYSVDIFFIAIGQFYANYNLSGISCRVIMFVHDIFDIERNDNYIDLSLFGMAENCRIKWLKRTINIFSHRWRRQAKALYGNIMKLYSAPNTIPFTVSNYSANALKYYFPNIKKEISICYSPMKMVRLDEKIENKALKELINAKKKYLFMIAANRCYKNPYILLKVFQRLQEENNDIILVTLKYGRSINANHVDIPFLSDSDMEHAYKNAYALVFASYFEGFGYPPIEAFKYGTPAIVANVTSIPEISGDAGIYFSPLYPADLYKAIKELSANREAYSQKARQRYKEITTKQSQHIDNLIKTIYNEE